MGRKKRWSHGGKNHSQGQNGRGSQQRRVPGMGEDRPLPSGDGQGGSYLLLSRRIQQQMCANAFLFNYINFVIDLFELPVEHFAPQRDDESPEQYTQRLELTRRTAAAPGPAVTCRAACDEDLQLIAPSDAGAVAALILTEALDWFQESGWYPDKETFRAGARPLLDAVCPSEHRERAELVHEQLWNPVTLKQPEQVRAIADEHPVVALHVVAAMTAWAFSQPACVPDPAATHRALSDKGARLHEMAHTTASLMQAAYYSARP